MGQKCYNSEIAPPRRIRRFALAMNPRRLHRHWRAELEDRVATIRTLLHRHRPLSAKEVHDLRVALRRARLLVSLGCHSIGRSKAKSFREQACALLDLVSPIRDCDVALEWLNETESPTQVVAKLRLRRDRLWHARKHRIRSSRTKLTLSFRSKHHIKKLEDRLEEKLMDAVQRCQTIIKNDKELSVTALHALRRIVRRRRYLRELLLKSRKRTRDARVRLLLKVQDSLGALQNTEAILNQLKSLGRTKQLEEIRSKLKDSYEHHYRDALQKVKSLPTTV